MAGSLLILPLLLAQAAPEVVVSGRGGDFDRVDVAYADMRAGQWSQAIERIEANRSIERDDPARLLNLGAAHARLGDAPAARNHFASALLSKSRYDLQLADGTWVDSREAARMALDLLAKGQVLALR